LTLYPHPNPPPRAGEGREGGSGEALAEIIDALLAEDQAARLAAVEGLGG